MLQANGSDDCSLELRWRKDIGGISCAAKARFHKCYVNLRQERCSSSQTVEFKQLILSHTGVRSVKVAQKPSGATYSAVRKFQFMITTCCCWRCCKASAVIISKCDTAAKASPCAEQNACAKASTALTATCCPAVC